MQLRSTTLHEPPAIKIRSFSLRLEQPKHPKSVYFSTHRTPSSSQWSKDAPSSAEQLTATIGASPSIAKPSTDTDARKLASPTAHNGPSTAVRTCKPWAGTSLRCSVPGGPHSGPPRVRSPAR